MTFDEWFIEKYKSQLDAEVKKAQQSYELAISALKESYDAG